KIILVNDGSNDTSIKIIKSYKDERIRVINNPKNMRIPYTRNIGLKEARGKYIAIMDADDISRADRIEKQVTYMEQNPGTDALGSDYEQHGAKRKRKVKNKYITSEEIKIRLLFSSPLANPTAMIRMKTLKKFDLKYNLNYFVAQDYDMWVQLSKVGKINIIPEVLIRYRVGHSNISKMSRQKKAKQRKQIIDPIHEDVLSYHGFQLSKEDIKMFNAFFTDDLTNNCNDELLSNIPSVITRIVEYNDENKIFNNILFHKLIHNFTVIAISNLKINLKSKVVLYSEICKSLKISKNFRYI